MKTDSKITDISDLSGGGAKGVGKTLQVFVRGGDQDAYLCGPAKDRAATLKAIGHFIDAEFEQLENESTDVLEIQLESYWMTDEELKNLPDL